MPANTSPSALFTINEIVLLAYKRTGSVPVEATIASANITPKLEHGRRVLDLIIDSLATKGFAANIIEFRDLQLVAGESQYTMDAGVLDVIDDAMFVPVENPDTKHTSGELVCKQVDMGTWQTLTTKGSTSSRPQLYTSFRDGQTPVLRFWPVPTEAGVMRLKTVRCLGSNADGTKNPDLQRYWFDALVWCLAYYIAVDSNLPSERVALLKSVSDEKKQEAIGYSFEHTDTQAILHNPNQWSC